MISKQLESTDSWPSIPEEVWYEYRKNKIRPGSPILLEAANSQYRYRSLYGYDRTVYNGINSRAHTRGMSGENCFSNLVIIDCDTEEEVQSVSPILKALGIGYSKWTTGNRGCHFHIPIAPVFGKDVIFSQICWLKEVGLWDHLDSSIYRENGQIRVPGAVHEKTGLIKEKLYEVDGTLLTIKRRKAPPRVVTDLAVVDGTPLSRNEYHRNLFYKRSEGGRHTHMFILWNRGKAAGYDSEEIKEDIRWWNDTLAQPPHRAGDVEMKLRGFR